ncbi:GNAT family N-acetyltransferase [Undibacterium sp. TS12]|uniref:GNAT family N-acetyltransferase n=1 Tax=Undibacterium sp. TS12 TaxID=2908202 RepID=UPI001F4D1FF3|nr:GNAT family N-acetyltransferase [Undibacterium sp. TS12]MCH8617500.1 GNAT family N-acetyltransferase [Undibacterium sp. TS12]
MQAVRPAIHIRVAILEDALALAGLLDELGFPTSVAEVVERLQGLMQKELILVAVKDGVVVGLLTIHMMPVLHRPAPVGRLSALVVTAKERGSGVGRMLVEAGEQALLAKGCGLVELTSNKKLLNAHLFYEHLGYEVTSLRFKKSFACGTSSFPV